MYMYVCIYISTSIFANLIDVMEFGRCLVAEYMNKEESFFFFMLIIYYLFRRA